MNEIQFRNWLSVKGKNQKVICDMVSRLKRLERELGQIDIDEEYKKDQCFHLLSLFENTGRNARMSAYKSNLPIGKYYLSTFKYALNLYVCFLQNKENKSK